MSGCKCECGRTDWSLLALIGLIVLCWGEPDLLDAMIHYLMAAKP